MIKKFMRSEQDIKNIMEDHNIFGTWSHGPLGKLSLKTKDGGILNFWESTGTACFHIDLFIFFC